MDINKQYAEHWANCIYWLENLLIIDKTSPKSNIFNLVIDSQKVSLWNFKPVFPKISGIFYFKYHD